MPELRAGFLGTLLAIIAARANRDYARKLRSVAGEFLTMDGVAGRDWFVFWFPTHTS